jgi:hypothetical protein
MLENEKQRRWWFANHPEYSSSRKGRRKYANSEGDDSQEKVTPESVDAYVDEALKYVRGTVAALLKSFKRNFGTQADADDHDGSGDNRGEEFWSGQQEEPYPTIGPAPPPGLGDHARSVLDFVLPGFTTAYDRWRTGYYNVYPWAPGPAYDALPGLAVLVGTGLAGIQASLARAASASEIAALQSARQELLKLWDLPFCDRGKALEILLGRNLHEKFKVIDRWVDGVATSIKTMDLRLKSYQTAEQILSRGRGYVHKVANFKGASMGEIDIAADKIAERVLRLGVHPEFNQVQEAALKSLIQYGRKFGVKVEVFKVP